MAHQICLIEDHDWLREIYVEYLDSQPELSVACAFASGKEALSSLHEAIDLVLVDISLGDMSGLDVVREVRSRWPSISCIVLSGQPAVQMARTATNFGAARYVEKGNTQLLLDAIHDVLSPS